MKKFFVVVVILSLLLSISLTPRGRLKAGNPSGQEIVAQIRQKLIELKSSPKGLQVSNDLKQKRDALKIPVELIDGVEIPKSLAELKKIKNSNDLVPVAVDGNASSVLEIAVKNNIDVNSLDVKTNPTILNTLSSLKVEHTNIKNELTGLSIAQKNVKDVYFTYNGIILETRVSDVKKLYSKFGKDKVHIATVYKPDLDYSVPLIGAGSAGVWTDPGVDGTGMYVGVVDTGVDYTHPDLGGDGTNHNFPTVKVVAGYDFGDNDSDPMDSNGHGTHVSGIMAADGTVKGVAPKAKIVIAKIVQGDTGSASSLDIAVAFDYMADPYNLDGGPDGTHPPVAAVNMSFGADAGFIDSTQPDQQAIENCVASGIFVSLAAGNAYWSYYGYGYYPFFPDWAMIGSPSVTPSAISVGASYNTAAKYPALTRIAPTPETNYAYTVGSTSPDPIATLGDNSGAGYPYVYCGYGGSPSDFPSSVSGKIALIKRGTYTFTTKITNAYNAGVIGVVIFNNTSGFITMNTSGAPNIPSVFISLSDGNTLLSHDSGTGDGTGRIGFRANTYVQVPQAGDTMVNFSSWGPPPDLSFKPEITAPGGGIWSTVPVAQGSYDNYSGTSMAAPHVGAVGALVKEAHPNWFPSQIKTVLMNTADILVDPTTGTPYSVLKMGAGRVNVYNALHTNVTVANWRYAGDTWPEVPMGMEAPYVALGDLPNYKTAPVVFTVRLTNSGSTDATYDISSTIQTTNFYLTSMALTGATVTTNPSGTVTVTANGVAYVTVTIDATYVADWTGWNYLEGFIKLTPSSGVELHIPYMGVLGKWNQFTNEYAWDFNPLIDPAADDPMNFTQYLYDVGATWPQLTDGSNWYYAGVDFNGNLDRNAIAFNPDADPTVQPNLLEADLWMLRNAQNLTIEIRDQNNNLINLIDSMDYAYKMIPDYGIGWYYYNIYTGKPWLWDGTDSNGNPSLDGKYKLVLKATPPKIFDKLNYDAPQVVEFLVSVDRVPPSTKILSVVQNPDTTVTVTWTASDPAPSSGLWGFYVYGWDFVPPTSNSYILPSGSSTNINDYMVFAIDNAWNFGIGLPPTVSVSPYKTIVPLGSTATFSVSASDPNGYELTYGVSATPTPAGSYQLSSDNTKLYFAPAPTDIGKTFRFTVTVTNIMGAFASASCTAEVYEVPVDTTPPTVTLPSNLTIPGGLTLNAGTLTFTVSATDDSGQIARMVAKVNGVVQIDKNNLDPTIYLSEGANTVEVTVYDPSGNYAAKSFKVISDTKPPLINVDVPDSVTSQELILKGSAFDMVTGVQSLTVNGNPVIPTIQGNFETKLALSQGANTITIEAIDKAGNKATKTFTVSYIQPQVRPSYLVTLKINDSNITVNGILEKIDAQGSKPIIKNGRTLLPIRTLIEFLGGTVEWNGKEQKVTIELNGHSMVLWIGKTTALVDGSKTTLDVAPMLINGRTYLPLRFISEHLGASVNWDESTQTITIYYWP